MAEKKKSGSTETAKKKVSGKTAVTKQKAPTKQKVKVEITKDDMYLFGNGTHYVIYKKLRRRREKGSLFCCVGTACSGRMRGRFI